MPNGSLDAAEYKHVGLRLLFLERVSVPSLLAGRSWGPPPPVSRCVVTLALPRGSWRLLRSHAHETCPDCGAPVPGYSALLWITDDEPDAMPCPACGIWLDGDGVPITPNRVRPGFRPATKVIVMTDRSQWKALGLN